MSLSDKFHEMLSGHEDNPEVQGIVADMVFDAPDSAERDGLMALIYHEGIGVSVDLDRCFELAEKAAFGGGDALGYFLLGYMCDNTETPDQAEGGSRQKYDHYDAERFYEICAGMESRWKDHAVLWLGDYYMDMAQGGDPDIAVEYYESIASENAQAAGRLSDYYWDLVMPEYLDDEDWTLPLFKWTCVAVRLDPEEYSYRMGWIYADGIGCERQSGNAVKYFEQAYSYDDWRGAKSIARLYEEYLEENPEIDSDERHRLEAEIRMWDERGDRLREKSLTESEDEADDTIEED